MQRPRLGLSSSITQAAQPEQRARRAQGQRTSNVSRQNSQVTSILPCSSMMLRTSASPSSATALHMRSCRSAGSQGP